MAKSRCTCFVLPRKCPTANAHARRMLSMTSCLRQAQMFRPRDPVRNVQCVQREDLSNHPLCCYDVDMTRQDRPWLMSSSWHPECSMQCPCPCWAEVGTIREKDSPRSAAPPHLPSLKGSSWQGSLVLLLTVDHEFSFALQMRDRYSLV
jgi:hypothetical protein